MTSSARPLMPRLDRPSVRVMRLTNSVPVSHSISDEPMISKDRWAEVYRLASTARFSPYYETPIALWTLCRMPSPAGCGSRLPRMMISLGGFSS